MKKKRLTRLEKSLLQQLESRVAGNRRVPEVSNEKVGK